MTTTQILATGIAYICTPGPTGSWDHDIQTLLDKRDELVRAEQAAEFGSHDWHWTRHDRFRLESCIGTALGIHDYRRSLV
ncbi:hypothetical protein ACGF0D_10630 [Kitasatospora sp. NPDC048298]|uniref:hypothetical protein n=1 Tax=Kitasatospora sp. NPDC048298 TaxID=3364049 RepID=UPI0037201DDB